MNEAHRDTYRLGCKEIRMYIEKIKASKSKKIQPNHGVLLSTEKTDS